MQTILLVDDDEMMRAYLARTLRRAGYLVLAAGSSAEAVRLSRGQSHEPIHLLLTDVVLPESNGIRLAEELVRERPDLRVVCMSGYGEEILARYSPPIVWAFLPKPFEDAALLAQVRRALVGPAVQ